MLFGTAGTELAAWAARKPLESMWKVETRFELTVTPYKNDPVGSMASCSGGSPTVIGLPFGFSEPSLLMTKGTTAATLAAYRYLPFGVIATYEGPGPAAYALSEMAVRSPVAVLME